MKNSESLGRRVWGIDRPSIKDKRSALQEGIPSGVWRSKRTVRQENYSDLFERIGKETAPIGRTALVPLTGGIESTTVLALANQIYDNVIVFERDYEGRSAKEAARIRTICEYFGVDSYKTNRPQAQLIDQLHNDLPQSVDFGESNLYYFVIAVNTAREIAQNMQHGDIDIIVGHILTDWWKQELRDNHSQVMYARFSGPREFVQINNRFRNEQGNKATTIRTPLIYMTKKDVVKLALDREVPLELTWSCDKRSDIPCASCSSCVERRIAFSANNIPDPAQ